MKRSLYQLSSPFTLMQTPSLSRLTLLFTRLPSSRRSRSSGAITSRLHNGFTVRLFDSLLSSNRLNTTAHCTLQSITHSLYLLLLHYTTAYSPLCNTFPAQHCSAVLYVHCSVHSLSCTRLKLFM